MDKKSELRSIFNDNQSEGYRSLFAKNESAARKHFGKAAQALEQLNQIYDRDIRPIDEQARSDLEIGRMYWRAGHSQAKYYYDRALEGYTLAHMLQNARLRLHAACGSAYILLFLEEFELALEEARAAVQLERSSAMSAEISLGRLYGNLSYQNLQAGLEVVAENAATLSQFLRGNRKTLPRRELLQLLDLRDFLLGRAQNPNAGVFPRKSKSTPPSVNG